MTPLPALRNLIRLTLIGVLVYAAIRVSQWAHAMMPLVDAGAIGLSPLVICGMLLAYAILLALPFVPGIEVGLALLMIEGSWVAPAVYGATLGGLLLAYAVGCLIPFGVMERTLRDCRLARAADIVARIAPLDPAARLALLHSGLPRWIAPVAPLRYLVLAVLINLPGNIALGGGGGLLLYAGLSRLFAPLPLLLTLMVAVAPLPLAVWFLGYGGMH